MVTYSYIHGLHEPGGEHLMASHPGFILFLHEVGHDPGDHSGFDYTPWTSQGFTIIARINHGYGSAGTIPVPAYYADFAQRVENFVGNSSGCSCWVIGNEPNHSQERPEGQPIFPWQYAACFNLCADGILSIAGHEQDQVIPAAVATWNTETTYDGNPSGDWLQYFTDQLEGCDEALIGGIALHTYTHGTEPSLITSEQTMDPPYQDRRYHFRAYRDYLNVVPAHLQNRAVYITETDQYVPWANVNSGWVQAAMKEIDCWNRAVLTGSGDLPLVHACILYRWPRYDQWYIQGLAGVEQDFQAAADLGYHIEIDDNGGKPPVEENWTTVFYLDCENLSPSDPPDSATAFYDQKDIPELTIPKQMVIQYRNNPSQDGILNRPEADYKYTGRGQPEVYQGKYSAFMFLPWSTVQAWYLSDRIAVPQHTLTRGSVFYMHKTSGGAEGGAQAGIVLGDGPFVGDRWEWPAEWENPCDSPNIHWGDWLSTYEGQSDYLPENEWRALGSPEVDTGEYTFIRFIVRMHINTRREFYGGHFDNFLVEVLSGDVEPPEPGDGACDPISSGVAGLALAIAESLVIFANAANQSAGVFQTLVNGWLPEPKQTLLQRIRSLFIRDDR